MPKPIKITIRYKKPRKPKLSRFLVIVPGTQLHLHGVTIANLSFNETIYVGTEEAR